MSEGEISSWSPRLDQSDDSLLSVDDLVPNDAWAEIGTSLQRSTDVLSVRAAALLSYLYEVEDNWDGHGAFPPAPRAIDRADQLLRVLLQVVPDPDVLPTVDGGVLLEWESPSAVVSIAVSKIGAADVLISDLQSELEGPLDENVDAALDSLLTLASD